MRTLGFLLLLGGLLPADVVVLKGGGQVSGRVVDKGEHYEVTTDAGLRTYLKDEVEKVLKSSAELVGDSVKLYEGAKQDYQKAVALTDPGQQQTIFKEAVAKVTQAREAYARALDLFPEDEKVAKQLQLIMQLMRLCRERLGSEIARGGAAPARTPTAPAGTLRVDDALTTLRDAARRADAAARASARGSFRSQRTPENHDMATAAMLFLSRSDAEWKLQGPALAALQEYFDKPWLKDPQKLTRAGHQEAALWIADRVAALRKADAAASSDALRLFALGHLSHAPAAPETEKAAKALGYEVQGGVAGTMEGHVLRDLNGWIANGDFDLAVLAFVRDRGGIDTPAVRFVWSYALLRLVQARKRGFDRPVGAYITVKGPDAPTREHLAALVKSIQAAGVCGTCGGEGKLRCTNCHGKKTINFRCERCKGKGSTTNNFGVDISCVPCRGTGSAKMLTCEKCKEGTFDCKQCDAPKAAPELEEICGAEPCRLCEGRGLAFRNAAVACAACLGLGQRLTPKSDPAKVLPRAD